MRPDWMAGFWPMPPVDEALTSPAETAQAPPEMVAAEQRTGEALWNAGVTYMMDYGWTHEKWRAECARILRESRRRRRRWSA